MTIKKKQVKDFLAQEIRLLLRQELLGEENEHPKTSLDEIVDGLFRIIADDLQIDIKE